MVAAGLSNPTPRMKKLLCVVVSLGAAWIVCDAKDWEQETLGEGDSESTGL